MNDIKGSIASLAKNVMGTSQGIMQSAKLNLLRANEEEKIKAVYIEIGKKVHEIYSYGGEVGPFFTEKYNEIISIERKIKELNDKIEVQKKSKEIYHTESIPAERIVSEIKEEPELKENESDKTVAVSEKYAEMPKKVCSICKSQNDVNEKFCLGCGRML